MCGGGSPSAKAWERQPFASTPHHTCRPSPLRPPHHTSRLWPPPQVHGDVFRPPRHLEVLSALVGTGVQLALLVLSVILITIAGGWGGGRGGGGRGGFGTVAGSCSQWAG